MNNKNISETKKLAQKEPFSCGAAPARSWLLRCQRAQQKHISGCKCHVTAERWTSTWFDVSGKSEHNSGCSHDVSSFHDSIHTRTCTAGRRRCVKLSFGSVLAGGACPSLICVIYSLWCALFRQRRSSCGCSETYNETFHLCCLASGSLVLC